MANQKTEISVFIASPSDLAPERAVFKETIDSLNTGFGDGANVTFVPHGWEDVRAFTGRRPQSVINREIDECQLFILALHRRWGQGASDSDYSSYTEEEFHYAFNRWKKERSPEVLVFFKNVDEASVADPGAQLSRVLEFRTNLEKSGTVLIRRFNTETDFGEEVDRHLRAFARNEWQAMDEGLSAIDFPEADINAINQSQADAEDRMERAEDDAKSLERLGAVEGEIVDEIAPDLTLVKAEEESLAFTRAAIEAVHAGRTQDASILFAKATEGTTNLSVLAVATEFYQEIGDLDNANSLVRRRSALAHDRSIAARHYIALLPDGFLSTMREQMLAQMLMSAEPEVAEEIASIHEEAFGEGRFEQYMMDLMVKYYSTAELMAQAQTLGTAEGQSALQKQPLIMAEAMSLGGREFTRIYNERHGVIEDESDSSDLPLDDPSHGER